MQVISVPVDRLVAPERHIDRGQIELTIRRDRDPVAKHVLLKFVQRMLHFVIEFTGRVAGIAQMIQPLLHMLHDEM